MTLARRTNKEVTIPTIFNLFDQMWPLTSTFFGFPMELDNKYLLRVTLPGFKENEIKVEVKNDVLTIIAEINEESKDKQEYWRVSNKQLSSWSLPKDVDLTKIDAELQSGVLVVTLPKTETRKEEVKNIPVKSGK